MTRPPRIRPESLRDHAEPARVNRVWRRLERRLAVGAAAGGGAEAHGWRSRRLLLGVATAAVVASFGAGIVLGRKIESHPAPSAAGPVAPLEGTSEQRPALFAAGTLKMAYDLPGGGSMKVSPGGIVERVSQSAGGVTLRLVRGQAELATDGSAAEPTRISMLVGGASVSTEDGVVRVRTDGDTADLEVLSGSAEIASPDPEVGLRTTTVREHERLTIPTRVAVTRVPPTELTTPPLPPRPLPVKIAREPVPGEPAPTATAEPPATWQQLCMADDFAGVLKQLQANAIDIAKVTSARDLLCIADATRFANDSTPRQALERAVNDRSDPQVASLAAWKLAALLEQSGEHGQAAKYYQAYRDLSPGGALAEDALCNLIEAEDRAGHRDEAMRLGQKYLADHATGGCRARVAQMLLRLAAERAKDDGKGNDGAAPKTDGSAKPGDAPAPSGSASQPAPSASASASASARPGEPPAGTATPPKAP
ncbi:MAG: hypothetical protein IT373_00905 [Polyangiaceae bacterium]|nr:hypothetical protein [Polyangiaceae bacterium]